MGRTEIPLDPMDGLLAAFACGLRKLRQEAGGRSYRELARKAHFSASTLSIAAGGRVMPSLPVVQGFVRACGGEVEEWTRRWHELNETLEEPGSQASSPWEPVRRIAREELTPGDLVVTADRDAFLVFAGDGRVVEADVWPGRHPDRPIPDPGNVKAYIRSGPSFFTEHPSPSWPEGPTLIFPEIDMPAATGREAAADPEPATADEEPPRTPPGAVPGRHRARPSRRRVIVLAATATAVAASGTALLWPGGGGHAPSQAHARTGGAPSAKVSVPGAAGPVTAAPGTEVIAGPGCPAIQGISIAAGNGGDPWAEVGGGPVECGGHALAAHTTTSTTLARSTYTWTMRTLATRCRLQVYIADSSPSSATAHYAVYGTSGLLGAFNLDQAGNRGRWVAAGTWNAPGGIVKLVLTDQADYAGAHHHITASAASFTCR